MSADHEHINMDDDEYTDPTAPAAKPQSTIDDDDYEIDCEIYDDLDVPTPSAAHKPLTALQKAARELTDAENKFERAAEGSAYYRSSAESAMARAVAYAQMAQAEALQRIAECLETDLDDKAARVATALERNNYAAWGVRPDAKPASWDAGSELMSEHKRAKEQHAALRRGMGLRPTTPDEE
jgi:hypothetical protein